MKVHISIIAAVATMLGTHIAGSGQRTIMFDPDKTIASQLLASDSQVTVVKVGPPEGGRSSRSLDERIAGLRQSPAVLLISGVVTEGVITPDGTWIRSRMVATIEQVATVANHIQLNIGAPIEFWHRNGSAVMDRVTVRAGEWPVFAPDQRYIVGLEYAPKANEFTVGSAFEVDSRDRLAPVLLSNSAWFSDAKAFDGVPAQELFRRIAARQ